MKDSKKRALIPIFSFVAASLFSVSAHAVLIWGTDASGELTGSRTSLAAGGITATEQWDNGGFGIDWTVTQDVNTGTWTYTYDVVGDTKALSHFILEVTDDGQPFNIFSGTSTPNEGPKTFGASDPSNPLIPNDMYGVKFDFGDTLIKYIIETDRAPVYGVFYTKDGKNAGNDVVAWSDALSHPNYKTTTNLTATDYIVRPDGVSTNPPGPDPDPIPAPAPLALIGLGSLLLGWMRRRSMI